MSVRWRAGLLAALLLVALLAALLGIVAPGNAVEARDELIRGLMDDFHAFSDKHGLRDSQMQELLGEIVLNQKFFSRKGGLGLIENDTYVVLDERKNGLRLSGTTWQGKDSTETEVVLTDGRRILEANDRVDAAHLIIVIFTPTEVRLINVSGNSGGKYERFVQPRSESPR